MHASGSLPTYIKLAIIKKLFLDIITKRFLALKKKNSVTTEVMARNVILNRIDTKVTRL